MPFTEMALRLNQLKNIIGALVIIGGILVSAAGMLKVPAQQDVIAKKLEANNTEMRSVHDETNRKLDILICLQAHLEPPIKCIARQ